MTKVKRNFKDSLFRLVFHGKEELLSLYNAVNGSSYTNADDLEINTLEDVVYMGMKNDVSFLFAHYLNLYEAQSTSNPNMPLRGTIYFGDLLKGWIESNHLDMYSEKQIMIPKPKFLVFYNGLKKEPERRILRLSDSFEGGQDARSVLEYSMSDLADADRKAVQERIDAGQTMEAATEEFLTEEYFDRWYEDTLTKLQAYEG